MSAKRLLLLLLLGCAPGVRGDVSLEVVGDNTGLRENLRAGSRLAAEACDAPEWRVRRLFKRAEEDLQPALRAFGYYRAQIRKTLAIDKECWQARFSIDPGKRVTIRDRRLTVRGEIDNDPKFQALLSTMPLAVGEPLHHGEYEQIKTRLRDFALERGYFDFEITRKELRVYPDASVADIRIEARSGPRYRYGELKLGEHGLDETFVRRLASIKEGEPYDARSLTALNREFSDSGYFRRVEVRARREARKDGKVPVDVLLEPAPRHAWRAGLGFATDTGPRVSLRYENRRLNTWGHRLESELRLSPVESGLTADYLMPGADPQHESFSIGVGLLHEDTDSATSDSARLIGRQTLKTEYGTQTRFIELLRDRSDVGGERIDSTLLMPGLGFDRVKADDILRARHGYRFNVELRGAYEGLVSDASFLQLRIGAKGIHRFGDAGRLTGRVDGGVTLGDSATDLPASLRFFAGGDNGVRGYAFESLGPLDSNGDVTGGHHLLVGSIEYEHPVFGDDWWVAAFADAGNAFDSDRIRLKGGYGVGVRWYSPVGRLRLDLAFPDDTKDDEWRLHFGLGADL